MKIFPDSTIAKSFKSKHTKTRSIVKHVLADQFQKEIMTTLKNTKFSIIIDESTDISAKKQMALVVRFYCERDDIVRSQFLKLIESLTQTTLP